MPVKRYEVDGNPYDVSEAKEQEFLSKFNNAVLIGVLDEDTNEVITQDEPQDFPTSTVEDADAVQQPMTASQAGFTESPSVNTLSDLEDPKPFVINGREVTQQEFEDYKRDTEKKEIYGTYLKEDGTTGYNEKPYSVQLQDYKIGRASCRERV